MNNNFNDNPYVNDKDIYVVYIIQLIMCPCLKIYLKETSTIMFEYTGKIYFHYNTPVFNSILLDI